MLDPKQCTSPSYGLPGLKPAMHKNDTNQIAMQSLLCPNMLPVS